MKNLCGKVARRAWNALTLARCRRIIHNRAVERNQRALDAAKEDGIVRELSFAGAVRTDDLLVCGQVKIKIDPPRVIETAHEIFVQDNYGFLCSRGCWTMIDIGMNVGVALLQKASQQDFVKVYGFEPLAPTYKLALANVQLNPQLQSKIEVYNFGLSDQDERFTVKYTPDHIMSVSSEGTFDACFHSNITEESIEVRQASSVLRPIIDAAKSKQDGRIFLKVDCEGAEFKIFPDLDAAGLLQKVDVAIIEWHGKSPAKILEVLAKNNFAYFTQCMNSEWNVGLIRAVRKQ